MKKANWANTAYKSTSVNWARSQSQIYEMLQDLGIYEIRFTNLRDRFVLEFLVEIVQGEKPRGVRIVVPLKHHESLNEDKKKKELNIVHRVLFNHLKAKFVSIQSGLTEFEAEFMAHLVVIDNNGNSRTMGEMILPEYKKRVDDGKGGDFKLLN